MVINNIDSLLEHHKDFAEIIIKKNRTFTPQIAISVNGEIIPIVIVGDRDKIKKVITMIEKIKNKLDWALMMHEGYMTTTDLNKEELEKTKIYKSGNLEERYLAGDSTIKWIFILQAYWREKGVIEEKFIKKMRVYEIKIVSLDFELKQETEDFIGQLIIDL